jgi:DNA-3-methyladenine glycosylase
MRRLPYEFYHRPCDIVARELVGKVISHGDIRLRISETEVYWGESDTACHAHKGKTKRTEVLWTDAGTIYIYLCYGMHWLLNIVTGEEGDPQAVLIRACLEAPGPGKLTKKLGITGEYNRKSILTEPSLRIEDDGFCCEIEADTRVGIGYASEEDQARLWRFKIRKVFN